MIGSTLVIFMRAMIIPRMMQALTWRGGPELTVDEIAAPEPGAGQVAFDVALAGICGSDLHPYRGHAGPASRRSCSATRRWARRPVAPASGSCCSRSWAAATCAACLRGEVNLCRTRGLVGLDRQGVFADRVVVDASALTPIPPGVDDRVAVLTEPLAASVSALRYAGTTSGDRVLVLGGGPIGLLAVHACVAAGIEVSLVEPVDRAPRVRRAARCRETSPSSDETAGLEIDLAIDAVGIQPTWQAGIAAVRMGGTVTIIGLGQAEGRSRWATGSARDHGARALRLHAGRLRRCASAY